MSALTPHLIQRPMDWNAKLVRFFLHNSRLVWLLLIAIVVGGVLASTQLRREGFPAVTPKVVLVQTTLPGATAEEMERQVTEVVENAVKDVDGLKQTSSTSGNSFSNVAVTLEESVNIQTALQDIQSKVLAAKADLPVGVDAPQVKTFSTSGPAYIFGVTNASADLKTIRPDAQTMIDALADVPGVKSAKLYNPNEERISITFHPQALIDNAISLQAVQQVLQGANINFPAGRITNDQLDESVIALGAFRNLDDIRTLIVGVNPTTGQSVTIQEIAEIQRGYQMGDVIDRFGYQKNGHMVAQPGVLISVEITTTADIIRTRQAIDDHIHELQTSGHLSKGIEFVSLSDQAKSTQDQISEILSAAIGSRANFWLLGGLQLLFIAMLLLVNWRAALVSALAIPISLLFTFLSLQVMGVQLNTIVLFSLILVLGLIVDPAIVMVEAIQRFRDLKYGSEEAILESGRRYGASLFMAVLTSVIVFVPFGVVSGIFGQIIKYIPLTVVASLIASYLVPVAFLPLLTKYLLRTHKPAHAHDHKAHEVEGLSAAAEWFMRVNRSILQAKWRQIVTLVVAFALVGGSISLVATGKVQTVQFAKPKDNLNISVNAIFNPSLSFRARFDTAKQIEGVIQQESGVDHYLYFNQDRSGIFLWLELKDKKNRGEKNGSAEIVDRLRTHMQSVPNLSDLLIQEVGPGTPDPDYQINMQLYDPDPVVLEAAAKDIGAFLAKQPHVIKVDDGFTNRDQSEIRIVLDRDKVQSAGLSNIEIGQQLHALIDESKVTKFAGDGGAADVYLVNGDKPTNVSTLLNLPVITRAGQLIRLGDVATVTPGTTVDAIQRFDGLRFVNVKARIAGTNADVFPVQRALNNYVTPAKLQKLGIDSNESRGEFDDIAKSFRELGIALVVAVLLTYIVLVLQFKSFSQPMVMIVTVPLSFIGVFPALWVAGSDLGFLELLGVTILVGIVENVAIFLLDYANQLVRERGLTPKEAIIQATGVRFRPILLTKLVAVGGLLPLAIESEFWRGLAITIMAGIGLSGFLSLIVIPILYVWIESLRTRAHRRIRVV